MGNILEVLQPILSLESDDERCVLLSDVMALLDTILPSLPEDRPEEVAFSSTKDLYLEESEKSRYIQFLKAREGSEAEKMQFLSNQDKSVLKCFVS